MAGVPRVLTRQPESTPGGSSNEKTGQVHHHLTGHPRRESTVSTVHGTPDNGGQRDLRPDVDQVPDLFAYMDELEQQRQDEAARFIAETPPADDGQGDDEQGDTEGSPRDLGRRFLDFHKANRHVYKLFEHRIRRYQREGVRYIGADLVLAGIRCDYTVVTKSEPYKINNNHKSFYSRLLLHRNPALGSLLKMRRSIADVDLSWIEEADAIDGYTDLGRAA
ncbi:hypothetical protein ACFYPX_18175 [Micromonospora zamorensis]|uniref:hypothetical protein n=1 Tax=Micromonospora zamorensis TaxID=709883 RepID=UPI00368F9736